MKNSTTAILLALFLGGFGAHHYYMGRIGLGVLYTVFFWTVIPGLIAFIEMFFQASRVRNHNIAKAQEIATKVKIISSTPASSSISPSLGV